MASPTPAAISTGLQAARILVVEDDPAMQRALANYLEEHRFCVTVVASRAALVQALRSREPDLILMDINLGADNGLDLLREVRLAGVTPVILMTGHLRSEADRVVGLDLGADDYIVKPFDMRELLARVRANLRRRIMDRAAPVRPKEQLYCFGRWRFNQRTRSLFTDEGSAIPLTKGEFALLSAFVEAPRRVISREGLLKATRLHDDIVDRSIDVQILRLRRKLEVDPRTPSLIRTERGRGYVFEAEVTVQ